MSEKLSEKLREDVKWRRQYKTYEIDDLIPLVEALEVENELLKARNLEYEEQASQMIHRLNYLSCTKGEEPK